MASDEKGMNFTRTSDFDMNMKSMFIRFYIAIANAQAKTSTDEQRPTALGEAFMVLGTFYTFFRPKVPSEHKAKKAELDKVFYPDMQEEEAKFKNQWNALAVLRDVVELAALSGITMDFDWIVDDYEEYGRS